MTDRLSFVVVGEETRRFLVSLPQETAAADAAGILKEQLGLQARHIGDMWEAGAEIVVSPLKPESGVRDAVVEFLCGLTGLEPQSISRGERSLIAQHPLAS